jgi:hypothetical protein
MSDAIHVATRKGLFLLERSTRGWAVARVSFLGDPVSMVLDDRRDGSLYAALALGHFGVKLHRSDDRGRSWTEVAAPAFPAAPEGASEAPTVHQIWALATGGPGETGALWAGTIPAALFRSADRGASWTLVRPLWDRPERKEWAGGGYDEPGLHSICVDPRDPRRLRCAISTGGIWASDDGGETWAPCGQGMYAEYMPPERREELNVQDVHRLAQCAASPDVLYVQHHNGTFRSTDGARTFSEITAIRPSKFGFAVAVHPGDPETAWFVPAIKDERRVPVDGKLAVARTRDGAVSFEVLRDGLPQEHAYDLVYRHGLDVSQDGRRLAMGSTTGGLWISEDGGDSWQLIPARLPPIYQVAFGG